MGFLSSHCFCVPCAVYSYVYLLWLPHYMSKLNNKYETDFKK